MQMSFTDVFINGILTLDNKLVHTYIFQFLTQQEAIIFRKTKYSSKYLLTFQPNNFARYRALVAYVDACLTRPQWDTGSIPGLGQVFHRNSGHRESTVYFGCTGYLRESNGDLTDRGFHGFIGM